MIYFNFSENIWKLYDKYMHFDVFVKRNPFFFVFLVLKHYYLNTFNWKEMHNIIH